MNCANILPDNRERRDLGQMKQPTETLVDPEIVQAIIDAAAPCTPAVGDRGDRLRACLAESVRRIVRKAPSRKLLTPREMERVMKAHDRFDKVLRSVQGAGNPPPMLWREYDSGTPMTPWTHWMESLKFREEKEELLNWKAIGELLAIFEALFGERIVQSNSDAGDSCPMCFLKEAFAAARGLVPQEKQDLARWYYIAPSASSLNKRLDRLRAEEMSAGESIVRVYLEADSQ